MANDRNLPGWMGKNAGLTPEEIEQFLAGPIVARLATIDEDGMPYITPLWQVWDGEAMWVVAREKSECARHIMHNPNVAISCADDRGTNTRVLIRGKAEIVSGPAPMEGKCLEVAENMARRFLGEHGPEYLVPTINRPRYLIRVVPDTMKTWDGVEWARKYIE